MTIPNLIFPVKVTIEKTDKSATVQDHLRREPINVMSRPSTFIIECQIKWANTATDKDNKTENTQPGVDDGQFGYIVVRTIDRKTKGVTIERGDRIIKLADRDVSLFVTNSTFHSHNEGTTDFQLEKYWFMDRSGR